MIARVLCFQSPVYLSLQNEQILVRYPDENGALPAKREAKTVPIEDVGVVVLENPQATITQALLARLLENNVAVITTDARHLPVGLLLPLDGHTLQTERFREQIDASEPLKKQMWQQTVVAKIKGQATVLESQNIPCNNMREWAKQVKSGDTDNLEGRAAAFYWRNVFGNPDFIRGQEGDPPNNLLNYGYALVRATVARALVAVGLLPTLGIHHHNRYNAYCLADDIMEPYRPVVDLAVIDMLRHLPQPPDELTPDIKRELLAILTKDVTIEGHRSPLMVAVQTTAGSVQKCFAGELRKLIYPDWN